MINTLRGVRRSGRGSWPSVLPDSRDSDWVLDGYGREQVSSNDETPVLGGDMTTLSGGILRS
jgi:hypothetical protein